MNKIRIGIIGYGAMGQFHAKYLLANEIQNAELSAVCEIHSENLCRAKTDLGDHGKVKFFDDPQKLFESGHIDAVLIATPHYEHPELVMSALEHNLHVMSEKPAGVFTKNVNL